MTRRKKVVAISLALTLLMGTVVSAQFGDLLKGGGIAFLVSKFGKDINKAVNKLTKTEDRAETYATKVVPIISVGSGKEAGACQIMGAPEAVDKVQSVAQLEGKVSILNVRMRGLIPIEGKDVSHLKRVVGVGVSGLIDVKL